MSPVKGSDLAKQIELARQDIERWPDWLKEAAGIGRKGAVESSPAQQPSGSGPQISDADFID